VLRDEDGNEHLRRSRSPRRQLRVLRGCCLPFISRIYSRRSYMERCSLPISPRRPFVPPPLCASNKHSDQENRLSPARDTIGSGLCARTRLYAECTALARIPRVLVSRSLTFYPPPRSFPPHGGSRECDKRQKDGPRPGASNKIADQ
jgi:hypothetical protein